jgi:hypothetical protein
MVAAGRRYVADVMGLIGPAAAGFLGRLARVDADLRATDATLSAGWLGHDEAFGRYAGLVSERRDLALRIASIEQDEALARETQAELVTRAIEAAGGPDRVAKGIEASIAELSDPDVEGTRVGIAATIADAMAGNEADRLTIEEAARSKPGAFADGFLESISEAHFERSQVAALVHFLIEAADVQ